MSSPRPTPQWQPLSQLPRIAWAIDGMADSAAEQLANLRQVEARPHVLDNHTVGRLIEVFTRQKADLWLFTEQLSRWRAGTLSATQRTEIERLDARLTTLAQTIDTILVLAENFRGTTIEATLAKTDLDVGLDALGATKTQRGRPRKSRTGPEAS